MKRKMFIVLVSIFISVFIQGCASGPQPIPATYFDTPHHLSVQITQIKENPSFRDSGNGGLIGLVVGAGRSSDMKEMFEGIKTGDRKETGRNV